MIVKKTAKRVLCLILILSLSGIPAQAAYTRLPPVDIRSAAALLMYAPTGEILYEHNIDARREPASITKIMTTLLALEYAAQDAENGGLDAPVTAMEEDFFDMQYDGSTAGIKDGETLTLRDLLYCVMVSSANEACNIVGRYVAGSVPAFIDMLNQRLAEMGCENTHFSNTHGLPDPTGNHYTTARDIARMLQECIQNTEFLQIAHTETHTILPTEQTPSGRTLKTTNFLIASNKPDYIYPPARGIKTGYTQAAGHCLTSLAEKNEMTLISVVLGAEKEEETEIVRSFTETRDLFEWGFANFTTKKLIGQTTLVAATKVDKGVDADEVEMVPAQAIEALVPVGLEIEDIEREIAYTYPAGVKAPVYKDQKMGTLTLSYQGRVYGTVDLLAKKTVQLDTAGDIQEKIEDTIEMDWVKYTFFGAIGLVVVYIIAVIIINVRRRNRRQSSNYRGNRRRKR